MEIEVQDRRKPKNYELTPEIRDNRLFVVSKNEYNSYFLNLSESLNFNDSVINNVLDKTRLYLNDTINFFDSLFNPLNISFPYTLPFTLLQLQVKSDRYFEDVVNVGENFKNGIVSKINLYLQDLFALTSYFSDSPESTFSPVGSSNPNVYVTDVVFTEDTYFIQRSWDSFLKLAENLNVLENFLVPSLNKNVAIQTFVDTVRFVEEIGGDIIDGLDVVFGDLINISDYITVNAEQRFFVYLSSIISINASFVQSNDSSFVSEGVSNPRLYLYESFGLDELNFYRRTVDKIYSFTETFIVFSFFYIPTLNKNLLTQVFYDRVRIIENLGGDIVDNWDTFLEDYVNLSSTTDIIKRIVSKFRFTFFDLTSLQSDIRPRNTKKIYKNLIDYFNINE